MIPTASEPLLTATTSSAARLADAQFAAGRDPATAAREFEAVFISVMLNSMTAGIEADAPFGGGNAEETWRGLQNEEIAKAIAAAGGVGIANAIQAELVAIQEGANK